MENHLLKIIASLVEVEVDFVVCGGVACVLQGCERTTFDIDIYPRMTEENLDNLIKVFKKLDFHPRIPEPIEHLKDEKKREKWVEEKNALVFTLNDSKSFLQVDLFLHYPIVFDELKKNADIFEIEGISFSVSSKQDLLAAKEQIKPPREKDIQDIRYLKELLKDEK